MHIQIWRFHFLLLPWIILVEKCKGQTTLLTLIDDMCITNTSSAMAMIHDLSNPFLGRLGYFSEFSRIKSKDKKTIGIEGMCIERECLTSNSWKEVYSFKSVKTNNLIMDKRWERFGITISTIKEKCKILGLQHVASLDGGDHKVVIPFSVQVKEEAHVFLCDSTYVANSNCFWFMLQAWKGLQSGFRKCKAQEIQQIFCAGAPMDFNNETIKWQHNEHFPKFLSEHQWNHFKIIKSGNDYSLEYPNGSKIFTVDTTDFPIKPTHLYFHTKKGIGLWKAHFFSYWYSETPSPLEYTATLTLSEGRNCLSLFAAKCTNCKMSIQFFRPKLNGLKEENLVTIQLEFEGEDWKEVKVVFNMIERIENVKFRIIPESSKDQNNFWSLDSIRPCNLHEIWVLEPSFPELRTQKCQYIGKAEILDLANNKKISTLQNWNKCEENEFGEDCLSCKLVYDKECPRTTTYCQLIKTEDGLEHKCYCFNGGDGENCKVKPKKNANNRYPILQIIIVSLLVLLLLVFGVCCRYTYEFQRSRSESLSVTYENEEVFNMVSPRNPECSRNTNP